MKRLFLNLCMVLISFLLTGSDLYAQFDESSINWLIKNFHKVDDLRTGNVDFKSFEPLKSAIGNHNIILLGEQTHGDGTTFEAKIKLVKFLHEVLGFNTIIFENGFYQSFKVWQELRKHGNNREIIRQGIHSRWSDANEISPLFSYIQQNIDGDNPLSVKGMDILFEAKYSKTDMIEDLELFLRNHNPDIMNSANYVFLKQVIQRTLNDPSFLPTQDEQNRFADIIDKYITELNNINGPHKWNTGAFWSQVLVNFRANMENNIRRLDGTYSQSDFFNCRDQMMAKNIKWIMESDKKVIIWASVTHNMRNFEKSLLSRMNWPTDTRFMGEYLNALVGPDKMFHITFTGYRGFYTDIYNNRVMEFKTPSPESIEAILYDAGFNNGYLILKSKDLPAQLKSPFKASFIFNKEYSATWSAAIDTVLFTRTMKASTRAK